MSRHFVTGIHSQSDEILADIFREYVEWADEDTINTSGGPWLLSRICRSWRKIALAHPEVWSFIRFGEPEYFYDSDSEEESRFGGSKALFFLNLALQRSQNHPLVVELDFISVKYEEGLAEQMGRMGLKDNSLTLPPRLVRAIVAHSNRWKKAELKITNGLIPLFAPIRNHLSLLTELTIWSTEDFVRPFPYAQNTPRLTNVTLFGYRHGIVSLPWSSIRHFSESPMVHPGHPTTDTIEKYLRFLRNNPQLKSLNLDVYLSPSSSRSALTHRSLRRLLTSEPNLICCLTLPKLEELVLTPEEGTMPAIRALLNRSKCTLRSLRLIDFILDEDVLAILSSSNDLRSLVIRLTGYDAEVEETMGLLVQKLTEPSFLPGLEELDIGIHLGEEDTYDDEEEEEDEVDGEDTSYFGRRHMKKPCSIGFINDAFVAMLAARWMRRKAAEGAAYLKQAIVLVELPSTVGLSKTRGVECLRKLCDEGLDVVIRARDPRALDLNQEVKDISYVYGF